MCVFLQLGFCSTHSFSMHIRHRFVIKRMLKYILFAIFQKMKWKTMCIEGKIWIESKVPKCSLIKSLVESDWSLVSSSSLPSSSLMLLSLRLLPLMTLGRLSLSTNCLITSHHTECLPIHYQFDHNPEWVWIYRCNCYHLTSNYMEYCYDRCVAASFVHPNSHLVNYHWHLIAAVLIDRRRQWWPGFHFVYYLRRYEVLVANCSLQFWHADHFHWPPPMIRHCIHLTFDFQTSA